MKRLALILALTVIGVAPASVSAKPPSFALWVAKKEARNTQLLAPLRAKCLAVVEITVSDEKAGACIAAGLLALWPKSPAKFDRAVARIAAPQARACKRAIHVYWQATRTVSAAWLIYLPAHQRVSATEFNDDLRTGTLGALGDKADAAKERAIRVCG